MITYVKTVRDDVFWINNIESACEENGVNDTLDRLFSLVGLH